MKEPTTLRPGYTSGGLSAALRREPTLRMATHATIIDPTGLATRPGTEEYLLCEKEEAARQLGVFLLNEGMIHFREEMYRGDLTLLAELWTVDPYSPNLDGRKADIEDARMRGRAEAAREILDAVMADSLGKRPWRSTAYDIIIAVEEKFRG